MKPEVEFDQDLREVAKEPAVVRAHIELLKKSHESATDIQKRVALLGELGVWLRVLGELDEAEAKLWEALKLIGDHALGVRLRTQQQIRLAHVLQWKKAFAQSDALFADIVARCEQSPELADYLDFALQHAGKNFFDQKRFQEALAFFERALVLRKKRAAPRDQIASTEFAIARTREVMKGG